MLLIFFYIFTILLDMNWYLVVFFTCISLMTNGIEHFLCAPLSFIYLLLWNVCSSLLPVFRNCIIFFVDLGEFFLYSGYKSIVKYICCRFIYQSLICLFIFLIESFIEQKVLVLMKFNLPFFWWFVFVCVFGLRNLCLPQDCEDTALYFLL